MEFFDINFDIEPEPIDNQYAKKIFSHSTLSYHFIPENKGPIDEQLLPTDPLFIFFMHEIHSGKYETGKFHLIFKIIAPENLTGISEDTKDIFQEWELIECIKYKEKPNDGVYVFKAWGRTPCVGNNFYNNLHHEGKKLFIDREFFETKIVASMWEDDNFPDEKLINTIGFENINFKIETRYVMPQTCEICGTTENITKFQVVMIRKFIKIQINLGEKPDFDEFGFDCAFTDVSELNLNGTSYMYKLATAYEIHTFCSLKCGFEFSVLKNALVIYPDSVKPQHYRAICPSTIEINQNMGEHTSIVYRGHPFGKANDNFANENLVNTINVKYNDLTKEAWFVKPQTCEICGTTENVTKFVVIKIFNFNKIPFRLGEKLNLGEIGFDCAFSDVNETHPRGTLYQYKLAPSDEIHEFCSLQCGFKFSFLNNVLVSYPDPKKDKYFRAICPSTIEINKSLGQHPRNLYRGHPFGKLK